MKSTSEKVKGIIAIETGVKLEAVQDDATLIDDLGMDSLDAVELGMALEEEFGLEIPDEEMEKAKTVEDVVKYIEEKLK